MNIPKPVRVLCYGSIAFGLSGVIIGPLWPSIGMWALIPAVLLFPVFHVLGGIPVDGFDYWLRRTTRDPVWLMTDEGRKRLATPEGAEWTRRKNG